MPGSSRGCCSASRRSASAASPDSADIQTHEFFAAIKWDDLLNKVTKPPFKSKSQSADDTQNFHKAFTNQKPIDSVSNTSILNELQQQEF